MGHHVRIVVTTEFHAQYHIQNARGQQEDPTFISLPSIKMLTICARKIIHDFAERESQNHESPRPIVSEKPSSNSHIGHLHIARQQCLSSMEKETYLRVHNAATIDYPEDPNTSENMVFDVLCQTFAEYETDRIYESRSDSTCPSDPIKQALPTLSERFRGHHVVPATSRPLPPHIGSDDITYLLKKGALSVPARDLQVVLLRSYVEFVQSQFPVLDNVELENWIHHGYTTRESNPGMIVFQAVMFAGSVFADARSLEKVGFNDRAHLQKVLFNRVRVSQVKSDHHSVPLEIRLTNRSHSSSTILTVRQIELPLSRLCSF
jgi:hypothetical protein